MEFGTKYKATGRRKDAIARVVLTPGTSSISAILCVSAISAFSFLIRQIEDYRLNSLPPIRLDDLSNPRIVFIRIA